MSGHAYGTMRENIYAAKEKGLKLIGISEHAPGIRGACNPIYFLNFAVVPRVIYGIEVFHGSEVNVLNDGSLSLDQRHLDSLDYGIVGIHSHCYDDQGIEKNTDNLISCMKNERIFFVSHPDDDSTPLDYKRLVEAAKKYHVALEVNNSSLLNPEDRLNCYENYRIMLPLCLEYRVPIYIASDAHDPSAVGEFSKAIELLEEIGFDEELIINNDVNKFKKFIKYA